MAHICQHLAATARATPERTLTSCDGREQTAGGFAARVAALSAALTHDLGVQPGDRVALAALNTDRHFEVLLAVMAAGGLVAPINWRWSVQDAVTAIAPCDPSVVFVDDPCQRFAALSERIGSIRHRIRIGGQASSATLHSTHCAEALIARHAGAELVLRAPSNGAAMLCFTSGTTAAPKAAVLSHAAFHVQSMSKLLMVGYCTEDVHLHVAPLCHIGGLSSAFAVLMVGGTHVFPNRFEATRMRQDLRQHEVTSFIAVPAMLMALWEGAPHEAYAHVQRVLIGGGTPTAAMLCNCRTMFPTASIKLSYAMTEACSSMTFTTIAAPSADRHEQQQQEDAEVAVPSAVSAVCVGMPAPGVEIAIQADEQLEAGQGIIFTRGLHVMLGYWHEGGASLQPRPDRWFATGDIGSFDGSGRLWLIGRSRDTIRTGSETVHASEVERCLQLHSDVLAAAVVGLPHERLGQQVAALVNLRRPIAQPQAMWQEQLYAFCREAGLSSYKLPRLIVCQAAPLPVNASGKLLKHKALAIIQRTRGTDAASKL